MPITFESAENGRLWVVTVKHPWSIAEFLTTYPAMQAHLDSAQWKVQLLIDFSDAGMWTGNALQARNAPYNHHPNRGNAAVVTTSPMLKAVSDAMIKISHIGYVQFFATKADGLKFLQPFIREQQV
jgi:hypothetical protein